MTPGQMAYLIAMVHKTQQIDESGDATLLEFLGVSAKHELVNKSVGEFLEEFLVWANGPHWSEWLPTAKQGDVPPK